MKNNILKLLNSSLITMFNYHNQTLFIYALEHNDRHFIEYILKKEHLSISIVDIFRFNPVHNTCEKGHLPLVQFLNEKGENIEARAFRGRTPLNIACWKGHLPIVQDLIEKGANIEAKDNLQQTPLHFTCLRGHLQIVEHLIEKGARIDAKKLFISTNSSSSCMAIFQLFNTLLKKMLTLKQKMNTKKILFIMPHSLVTLVFSKLSFAS